ncbi:hypothetical protein [Prevotella sp.]|uniref:hypothetical protein n=1 Tax=Prevotella sp. TaxID=59823 RepID=UPI003AB73AD2
MKRLADILLSVAALLLLAACTDDADVYNTPAPSEGNLCVYVPVTREGDEVTSSLDPSNPTYNASVDECNINDLHLYAFPVGGNGTFLSQELPSPEASNMLNEKVASYKLQIKPGTYRVYVVANMKDVLDVNGITTEDDLKDVVLGYTPVSKSGMPVADNIPMIYEPDTKAADGTPTDGTITINKTDTTPQTVMANLQFTCVKVCLNLIYNPEDADMNAALKSNGLKITDIIGKRLSPQTSLLWDTNPNVSDDYAKGFEPKLYDATSHTGNGSYYTSWTETPANANVNNDDIIKVKGEGVAAPANSKEKWLFRATYYLPERYVAQASQQSALKVDGAVGGSAIANSYNINLGHRKDETSTTEVPTFPRGTYYEIVGRIKSLGNIDLDCVVGVKDWQMATIDADFTHTTLWVSKTSAEVKSLQDDYIDYRTNADPASLKFECESKVNKTTLGDLEIIKVENDEVNKRLKFSINPDLSVADFTNAHVKLTDTVKVWIKANNLKKYLNVKYDVTPYFKVDPVDIVIQYDNKNTPELTKVVKFTTNLGGIEFPNGWSVLGSGHDVTYANSTINIKCENTQLVEGTFTIFAKTDPQTTTTHTFTVKSIGEDGTKKHIEQQIRVTVRPPVGPYRIYMRAINDLAWALNASTLEQFDHSEMLDEEAYNDSKENNNWRDGWWVQAGANWGTDRSSHVDYHKVYIYTQIGETKADGTKDENVAEWYFTGGWPGHSMKADNNNPGWYYYKIAHNAESEGNNNKGQAQTTAKKMIKPGQTLLIFSNGTYTDAGFQPHRFTHHNDPGITLFNYEDREGWYLYDPLSDPYYRVYDKKPTIVDVEYTIYTKNKRITAWYCKYGVNSQDGKGKFEMKSDNPNVENEFKCTECDKKDKDGNTWYKTILHLKAPLGEYDKVLKLKVNGDEIHTELFDGDNYPVTGKVTRTINGRNYVRYVIEGTYDPGTQTWKKGDPFKK